MDEDLADATLLSFLKRHISRYRILGYWTGCENATKNQTTSARLLIKLVSCALKDIFNPEQLVRVQAGPALVVFLHWRRLHPLA